MATIRELADYYTDLLLFQYRNAPRARATIGIYVKQALADLLALQIDPAFTLDNAVGPQLDILGKYIGVPRNIGLPVARPYHDFSDYDGTIRTHGFTDYSDPLINPDAIWYRYEFSGTENTALSDASYLFMLHLKVILNSSDGTLASIQQFLRTFFPNSITVRDNLDMSLTYNVSQTGAIPLAVITPYLPKPMGVFLFLGAFSVSTDVVSLLHRSGTLGSVAIHMTTQFDLPPGPTAIPLGGTGPYTYQWEVVSSDGEESIYQISIVTPTAVRPYFERWAFPDTTKTITVRCTVTDSLGLVAYSPIVSVTMTLIKNP